MFYRQKGSKPELLTAASSSSEEDELTSSTAVASSGTSLPYFACTVKIMWGNTQTVNSKKCIINPQQTNREVIRVEKTKALLMSITGGSKSIAFFTDNSRAG